MPSRLQDSIDCIRLRFVEDFISIKVRRFQNGKLKRADEKSLYEIHKRILGYLRNELPEEQRSSSEPSTFGVRDSEVVLSDSNSDWVRMFESESVNLQHALAPFEIKVHHTGSTSVPNLVSKPIIDMAVEVSQGLDESNLPTIVAKMESAGYIYLGNWGIRGGRFFEKKRSNLRTHAVQLHENESPEINRLLRFKTMLSSSNVFREEYARVKKVIANIFPHQRGMYFWMKAHWINDALLNQKGEQQWAAWWKAAAYPTGLRIVRRSVARSAGRLLGFKTRHPLEL